MSESAKTAPTVPSSDAITSRLPGSVVLPEYGPGHSYRGSETRVGATMPSGGGPDEDYGAAAHETSRQLVHNSARGIMSEKPPPAVRLRHPPSTPPLPGPSALRGRLALRGVRNLCVGTDTQRLATESLAHGLFVGSAAARRWFEGGPIERAGGNPADRALAVGDADGDGQGIRCVVRFRQLRHSKDRLDHALHLILRGGPVSRSRDLHFIGRRLSNFQLVQSRRQEDDTTSLADGEGRLDVLGEEQPLDAHERGCMQLDQVIQSQVDGLEALRQRKIGGGLDDAVIDRPKARTCPLHEPVAKHCNSRVYAQDDHEATSLTARLPLTRSAARLSLTHRPRPEAHRGCRSWP